MDVKTYIKSAIRTISTDKQGIIDRFSNQLDSQIYHSSLVITEISELFECAENARSGNFDNVNFLEECGDILWYLAIIDKYLGFNGSILEYKNNGVKKIDNYNEFIESIVSRAIKMTILSSNVIDMFGKKYIYYSRQFDVKKIGLYMQKINQEVGDLLVEAGLSVEQARQANIDKLRRRYTDKFSEIEANNRDINNEMNAIKKII